MAGIQFTQYIPLNLTGVNSLTKTLATETLTGIPLATGATPGGRFYLTEKQAASCSAAPTLCHAGWYRIVQVDAGATAANIFFGGIGAMVSLASGENVVTDVAHVLSLGAVPVVFLGAVTPGNYTFVQDQGDASLLVPAGQTVVVGNLLASNTANGTVSVAGAISNATLITLVGLATAALATPVALTLSQVAAASGGSTLYTGTITGGAANALAGLSAVITGFAAAANNGTFLVLASSATTLTLANPNGVAVTAAGTATLQGYIRARLGFPFGITA
jgi:hypothetical protein